MAIQTINIGTTANDGTGDDPRTAGSKINDNFTNSNHAASRDVGTTAGDVMEVGAGGLLDAAIRPSDTDSNTLGSVFMKFPESTLGITSLGWGIQSSDTTSNSYAMQIKARGNNISYRTSTLSVWDAPKLLWHTGNTTVDGSGFIKEASPIVKLYSDKIELNDYKEIENCAFERVDTGHYIIKGAPLLSRDGWYIETLKDRNNNIYFTLDYEELEDGLHVKTYTPDYSAGRATNGAPVDINDGRFVTLRFEEDKTEE